MPPPDFQGFTTRIGLKKRTPPEGFILLPSLRITNIFEPSRKINFLAVTVE